jgi:hypothetical protein
MAVAAPATPATPTYYTVRYFPGNASGAADYKIMATTLAGAAAQAGAEPGSAGLATVFGGPYSTIAAAKAAIPAGTPAGDITAPTGSIPGVTTPAPATKPAKKGATPATAAVKPIATIHQPKFDPRMQTVVNPLGVGNAQFERGFMIWDQSLCTGTGYSAQDPPAVSFLFNPSTIQASYSMSDSTAQAAMLFGTPGGTPFVGLQQTMNFTVMFDRTYEVNMGQGSGITSDLEADPQKMGCEVDIRQMKQFTGMFSGQNAATGFYATTGSTESAGALGTGQTPTQATGMGAGPQQGIMLIMPSYVYFGSSLNGGTSQYYGYINEWDVQYTHFTNTMVPIRCVVDVTFTLLPLQSDNLAEQQNGAVIALQNAQNQGTPILKLPKIPIPVIKL